MCLYTKRGKQPKIAEEDIAVYKILVVNTLGRAYSPFRNTEYSPHTLYKTDKPIEVEFHNDEFGYHVNAGLYAYTMLECAKYFVNCIQYTPLSEYNIDEVNVYKMTIPKGTRYLISDYNDEIVSDALYSGDMRPV